MTATAMENPGEKMDGFGAKWTHFFTLLQKLVALTDISEGELIRLSWVVWAI